MPALLPEAGYIECSWVWCAIPQIGLFLAGKFGFPAA
jgi:hypothetical protein